MRLIYWVGLSIVILFSQSSLYAQISDFQKQLESLPEVNSVTKIEHNPYFIDAYEIMVEQFLDHSNHQAGKFEQRVILSNFNKYSPVVFVTEGYRAGYALKSSHINELSKILEANQLVVEHRYFGKSVPDNKNWEYLSIKSATDDLHRIKKIFAGIYNNNNKWIATGISKGGQNTLAYKAYYPTDMDIWIPYVGPVNFGVEDARMEKFIDKVVANKDCRSKVEDFQLEVLKNRAKIQPLIDSLIKAEGYTFSISNEEVLDYCVLEYSFSFWQWGHKSSEIPADSLSAQEKFDYLMSISSPDYFALEELEPIKPFFIQTLKEFGYYGYNTKPFEPYLKIESAEDYIEDVFLNTEPDFKYSKKTSKFIKKAIQKDGANVLMIYGEYDPWTAGGIVPKKRSKAVRFVKPRGSHRTRINNMSYAQRSQIYMLLETWLEQD
ncbi:MAG: S28 family serine protease [Prolixibacteraceae bacterium]|nr:S28 family serine protease [Prolixibacteraceae bacterium]